MTEDAVARLLAAAQRARDLAMALAGRLRAYAWILAAGGVVAWLTWIDPWRLGSALRVSFIVVALVALLLPAALVARFAAGLTGLAGLPERIQAAETARAVTGAASTARSALSSTGPGKVRALLRALRELRRAIEAARTTAAAVAAPAAAIGFGGIASAMAGLLLGALLIPFAILGLLVAL